MSGLNMNKLTRVESCECSGPGGVSLWEWRAQPHHVDVRGQQAGGVVITRDGRDPGEVGGPFNENGQFHIKGPRKKVNVKKWIFFL